MLTALPAHPSVVERFDSALDLVVTDHLSSAPGHGA